MGARGGWGSSAFALLLAAPALAQTTRLVTVSTGGVQGDGHSEGSTLSADGRCVAFESQATNLVPGDTNGAPDIFVRDLQNGTTERVSVGPGGVEGDGVGPDFFFYSPALSADGRYVAFESSATNLVAADTNSSRDIFVRDRLNGTTGRVSVGPAGVEGDGDSHAPAISADGRFVAFQSLATNLVAGDTNGMQDVFVHDRLLGTTERVSLSSASGQGNGTSNAAAISADGRYVAFQSSSSDLVPGDTNGVADVFLRDRLSGTTICISVAAAGLPADNPSILPALSADGRCVAFASNATNLVAGDTNGVYDVFVRDVQAGTTERVSLDGSGAQGNLGSGTRTHAALSADGRWVAFESDATNLVPGDANASADVFLRDRQGGTTELVSLGSSGVQASSQSKRPSISADGRYVGFDTFANNLDGDASLFRDGFVRDRQPSILAFCFGDGLDLAHTALCPCGNFGAPGHGCGHSFDAGGAQLTASGLPAADDVQLASSSEPATSFTLFLQHDAPGDAVLYDGVLCASGNLIRLRGRPASGGQASYPNPLWDSSITLSQRGGVLPGQGVRRYYAAWFRNASPTFCPTGTANVTNGIRIDW